MDKVYPVCTLGRTTILLGRQLDHDVRRIVFDVREWLEEYPESTFAAYVMPPVGDGYPAKIDMEGGMAVWTILESDTAQPGRGMVQIKLIGKHGEKLHSANAYTMIEPSIAANAGEEPPNAAKPWFDQIMELLIELKENGVSDEQIAAAVEAYLAKHPIEGVTQDELAQAVKALNEQIVDETEAREEALNELKEANAAQDTAISKKANDADLAAVAKSGNYEDLKNKPTIPTVPTALKNPNALTFTGAVNDSYDGSAPKSVNIPAAYTLPIANANKLGGVKPAAKTDEMTQEVGVDEYGALFTAAAQASGGAGDKWELINDITVEEDLKELKISTDINGNPFNLKKIMIFTYALPCLVAKTTDRWKTCLSQEDFAVIKQVNQSKFTISSGVSATEGKQRLCTFYCERLYGRYARVNYTKGYDEGSNWHFQGYENGLGSMQVADQTEKAWVTSAIDCVFTGSWQTCIGAGSRLIILGVRM